MHRARHSAATRVFRPRSAVAMGVVAAGLVTAVYLPARFDNAEATVGARPVPDGERVVFHDGFDGRRGAGVDGQRWAADAGPQDGERQVFTDRDRNARLDGRGNLVITARRERSGEITSARLLTRESFTAAAGRAEARIRVADSRGVRSAFQLLGGVDVDVMRNRGDKSREVRGGIGDRDGAVEDRRSFADDFHTFTVDWAPGRVVWSVDGREFFRVDETLDQPFTPAVAVTVGTDADRGTRLPQRMLVDFVRVTVRADTEPSEPPATTPPAAEPTQPPATPPTTVPAPPAATTTPPPAPAAKAWKPFTQYSAGDRVTFDGLTYEVKEAHTSLPEWEPPAVPGLFQPL